jgi:hypothetical protein
MTVKEIEGVKWIRKAKKRAILTIIVVGKYKWQ